MTSDEIITLVKQLAETTDIVLNVTIIINVDTDNDNVIVDPYPIPAPSPPGDPTVFATIINSPRANARFVFDYNKVGKPIMQIYPSDTSDVKERVQFPVGTLVEVIAEPISADGGKVYWEINNSADYAEVPLYLNDEDIR